MDGLFLAVIVAAAVALGTLAALFLPAPATEPRQPLRCPTCGATFNTAADLHDHLAEYVASGPCVGRGAA